MDDGWCYHSNSLKISGIRLKFDLSSSIKPQNNRDLNQSILHPCPKFGDLAWTGDELSRRQAQNGVNVIYFEVKFDLEGQGQSHPKTIGILTKVFYTYGPNLVIQAWKGLELSHGQSIDWHTDELADAGNNTRRPKLASGNKLGIIVVSTKHATMLTIGWSTKCWCFNSLELSDASWHQGSWPFLLEVMACRLIAHRQMVLNEYDW